MRSPCSASALRAEDPELARELLLALVAPLKALGPCTATDRCGRCEHTKYSCRFDQVRQRLVRAFVLPDLDDAYKHRLARADAFLPMPKTASRGQPRRGLYTPLREAGDLDAAGHGAFLSAEVRRRQPDRDWALRTLERAWEHGSREPHLANAYGSMLAVDRRVRTGSHYASALAVCEAAPLSPEHDAAHRQQVLDRDERKASLEVCLAEHCEALAARMEDGISAPGDAADVARWALQHALDTQLPRRLLGRLLAGLGRAAP